MNPGPLKVTRVDLLSDSIETANVKIVKPNVNLDLSACKAITHPSNNAIFMIDQA